MEKKCKKCQNRIELFKNDFFEFRELTPEEQGKSIDYWAGYTAATIRAWGAVNGRITNNNK